MDAKALLELYANDPYIVHDDYEKCGQCFMNKIKQDVAKKYLAENNSDIVAYYQDVLSGWRTTKIFLRASELVKSGKSIDEALAQMKTEGYDP
jgi:hypothetical protein